MDFTEAYFTPLQQQPGGRAKSVYNEIQAQAAFEQDLLVDIAAVILGGKPDMHPQASGALEKRQSRGRGAHLHSPREDAVRASSKSPRPLGTQVQIKSPRNAAELTRSGSSSRSRCVKPPQSPAASTFTGGPWGGNLITSPRLQQRVRSRSATSTTPRKRGSTGASVSFPSCLAELETISTKA